MSEKDTSLRIDEILIGEGLVTENQVKQALEYQREHGGKLGSHLMRLGFVDETGLLKALSKQFDFESVIMTDVNIPPDVIDLIPANVAIARSVMPFGYDDISEVISIACENPQDESLLNELKFVAGGRKVKLYVAADADERIVRRIRRNLAHSDIDSIERVEILRGLRKSEFDCLIGINLLREGLDLPEVGLVAILDADKEGFLRSETALIQTSGRAARHIEGRVIMYADNITPSMRRTIEVTAERRERQAEYNRANNIVPQAISKDIHESMRTVEEAVEAETRVVREAGLSYNSVEQIRRLEEEMLAAADKLEYERAAILRDKIEELRSGKRKRH